MNAAATPLFAARSVTKVFRGLTALSGINFEIAPGETLGLIGPNGAGKTTLISLISGTLYPTSGELLFDGKRIDSIPAFRRARLGISRTFQLMKPFAGLSVLDNVAVGALFGTGGGQSDRALAREQAREWIEFTGLAHRIDQSAESLGGPDRKRLELAKALAMRPKFLLLDEVMAGLNPVEIDQVVELIQKIRGQGVTILVVEHVIKAVRQLSDRLLVIHHGHQIAEGKPGEVLERPEVVEAYLGKRRAQV
jgi:branched-chain amino acid transport system ATP-binding protein